MSTYMLTVASLVRAGRLTPYRARRAGLRSSRLVLLSAPALARISGPWGGESEDVEALRQELLVTLDRVVEGQPLSLLFGVLAAREGIVQLKLMKPRPGVRIVGGFLEDDVFAGMSVFLRDELPDKKRPGQTARALLGYGAVNASARQAFKDLGLWPLHKPEALFRTRVG